MTLTRGEMLAVMLGWIAIHVAAFALSSYLGL